MRRLRAGDPEPVWLAADRQTAGKGRRGRAWRSSPGDLAATLALCPKRLRPSASAAETATLSFVAGLAVADAAHAFAPDLDVTLKWPNDVLADGRKLAGVLLETDGEHLVVGVGVNLISAPPAEALEAQATPAVALAEFCADPPSRDDMLVALAAAFAHWSALWSAFGFAAIRDPWLSRAARRGQSLTARLPGRELEGVFRDLDETGALILETKEGRHRIDAAEIYFPAQAGASAPPKLD